jgi:hypothetical protein
VADKPDCEEIARKKKIHVYDNELILTGILRQELDLSRNILVE